MRRCFMDCLIVHFCELIKNVIHSEQKLEEYGEVDWMSMVQLAKEHNLFPIFIEAATKNISFTVRQEYVKETISSVAAQARRTKTFLKLYESFTQYGIYPLVMKGLICRQLYGTLCDHRPSADEDILIRISEYDKAKDVLLANGYTPQIEVETEAQLKNLQEVTFIHPTEKLHIELHLNVMGRDNDARSKMSDYFKNVFEEYREVNIDGIQIRTLNHQNHLLYLILHAFKHFISGGFGIRQMLDILLYQEQFGHRIDYAKLQKVLREFKADKFWTDLICIGNTYFGFRLAVHEEPNCPNELLADVLFCGAFGNGTQAQRTAARATLFSTGDYLKSKKVNQIVLFGRMLFPNKAYLLCKAPSLEAKPWLLLVEWIRRWGRFMLRTVCYKGDLPRESMQIARRRMDLLKKYDLL